MNEIEINSKFKMLPDSLKIEVLDYIEFLTNKYYNKKSIKKGLKFNWEGGLSEFKEKYSSVELQHKSMEWR